MWSVSVVVVPMVEMVIHCFGLCTSFCSVDYVIHTIKLRLPFGWHRTMIAYALCQVRPSMAFVRVCRALHGAEEGGIQNHGQFLFVVRNRKIKSKFRIRL